MRVIDTHVRLVDVSAAGWRAKRERMQMRHQQTGAACTTGSCAYAAHRSGGIDSFIHVSNASDRETGLAEAAWVEEIAALHDLDMVMIAGIDPLRPATEVLADLEVMAASESFRGVRLPMGAPSDLPVVLPLLSWLAGEGLVVEIAPQAAQLPGWVRALERFPDVVSVAAYDAWLADLVGGVTAEWREAFRVYAEGNVDRWQVTLPHDGHRMSATWEVLQPWLETGAEILGWDRLMFATTLALEDSAGQYSEIIEGFESLLNGVGEEDRAKFWAENAAQAYRM